jgi:allophanate hydrolase subunit 2
MKKILQFTLSVLALAFILQACSTTKSLVGASHGHINGTWTLTNVSYDGLVPGAVHDVFNQAPPAAFVNSTWKLTNSGDGMYTLANGTSQSIFWSYNDQDKSNPIFQFKKIYEGDKAKNITEGYQLNVVQVDGSSMTLKSPIVVGSKTAYIVYSFSKQ